MSSVYVMLCCTCITLLIGAREATPATPPGLGRTKLMVTSILADPFLRRRVNGSADGEEFEGFIPDLLKHVFRMLDVDYEISLVKDGRYGEQTADGSWDGMIGELTRGEADVAAGPLTVTSTRERVVDLSKPIWCDQIAAIVRRSHATRWDVRSVDDLGRQSHIKYGVLDGAATKYFFRTSTHRVYERMWGEMYRHGGFVGTWDEGLHRVISSTDDHPWAFIGESSLLLYAARGRCDLAVVPIVGRPAIRCLSLATPIGSSYRDWLTLAILELLENRYIHEAHAKWFLTPFTLNPIDCD